MAVIEIVCSLTPAMNILTPGIADPLLVPTQAAAPYVTCGHTQRLLIPFITVMVPQASILVNLSIAFNEVIN